MEITNSKPNLAKVYFPGMNGIRFIAAFSVIFHHIEQNKFWINDPAINNFPNIWGTMFCDNTGHKRRFIISLLSGILINKIGKILKHICNPVLIGYNNTMRKA